MSCVDRRKFVVVVVVGVVAVVVVVFGFVAVVVVAFSPSPSTISSPKVWGRIDWVAKQIE